MIDTELLDRAHYYVMGHFVETGHAPHYTDIARKFDIRPEAGKDLLHSLINSGLGATWLHPDTDYIATFNPFSNLPTQYRISVDGHQKWFAP